MEQLQCQAPADRILILECLTESSILSLVYHEHKPRPELELELYLDNFCTLISIPIQASQIYK